MTLTGLTELLMARIVEDEAAASAVKDICAGVWDVQVVHRSLDLDPLVTHSTDDGRAKLAQHSTRPVSWSSAMRCGLLWQSTAPTRPLASRTTRPTGALAVVTGATKGASPNTSTTAPFCALALPFADHPYFRDEWNP